MLNQIELQRAWDHTHQTVPASKYPEADVVAFIEHMRQRLPAGAPVLDAGCGRGRHTLYLARMSFRVYSCDLSPVAIETAKTHVHQEGFAAALQVASLTHLPYPNGLFAAAIGVHVLPYNSTADIAASIGELGRVLQANGQLYLDLLSCDDAEYGCGQELENHTFLDSDGVPMHFSSRREVNKLLHGFTLERVYRVEFGLRSRVGWIIWATKANRH